MHHPWRYIFLCCLFSLAVTQTAIAQPDFSLGLSGSVGRFNTSTAATRGYGVRLQPGIYLVRGLISELSVGLESGSFNNVAPLSHADLQVVPIYVGLRYAPPLGFIKPFVAAHGGTAFVRVRAQPINKGRKGLPLGGQLGVGLEASMTRWLAVAAGLWYHRVFLPNNQRYTRGDLQRLAGAISLRLSS